MQRMIAPYVLSFLVHSVCQGGADKSAMGRRFEMRSASSAPSRPYRGSYDIPWRFNRAEAVKILRCRVSVLVCSDAANRASAPTVQPLLRHADGHRRIVQMIHRNAARRLVDGCPWQYAVPEKPFLTSLVRVLRFHSLPRDVGALSAGEYTQVAGVRWRNACHRSRSRLRLPYRDRGDCASR